MDVIRKPSSRLSMRSVIVQFARLSWFATGLLTPPFAANVVMQRRSAQQREFAIVTAQTEFAELQQNYEVLIDRARGIEVGRPFPMLTGNDIRGRQLPTCTGGHTIVAFVPTYYVAKFWSVWREILDASVTTNLIIVLPATVNTIQEKTRESHHARLFFVADPVQRLCLRYHAPGRVFLIDRTGTLVLEGALTAKDGKELFERVRKEVVWR